MTNYSGNFFTKFYGTINGQWTQKEGQQERALKTFVNRVHSFWPRLRERELSEGVKYVIFGLVFHFDSLIRIHNI